MAVSQITRRFGKADVGKHMVARCSMRIANPELDLPDCKSGRAVVSTSKDYQKV